MNVPNFVINTFVKSFWKPVSLADLIFLQTTINYLVNLISKFAFSTVVVVVCFNSALGASEKVKKVI